MKHSILALFIICTLLLTGCSSKAEQVIAFQNELNSVITKMENIHNELESLDVKDKDASGQALEALSSLKDAFEELVAIDVKDEQFSFINDLAIEGSQYMEQAYKFFEEAYTSERFDRETADLAYQYLERATKRINVIITMLHGEVPEGVVVH
jgi:seryl-tRNA synthetase